jgi:hypothetical protein
MNRSHSIVISVSFLLISSKLMAADIVEVINLSDKGINFSIALFDEPKQMGWSTAIGACRDKNMRLPTLKEWGQIHCHSDLDNTKDHIRYPETDKSCENSRTSKTVPNLKPGTYYWSSTEFNMGVAQYSDSFDGHQGYKEKKEKLSVRCVQ